MSKSVKYSWWTARNNPHMIANEYLRLIKETKRRIAENERRVDLSEITFKRKRETTPLKFLSRENADEIKVQMKDIVVDRVFEWENDGGRRGGCNKVDYLFHLNRKLWKAVKALEYDDKILDDLITEAKRFCKKHNIRFTEERNKKR